MPRVVISGNGETPLAGGPAGVVSTLVFQVTGLGAGALTVKHRVEEAGASVACAYVKDADGSTVAGSTPIAADGVYRVEASGMVVSLSMASYAAPTTVDYQLVQG